MSHLKIPTGSRWTVLSELVHRSPSGKRLLLCRCVCGVTKTVLRSEVISGRSRSCNCYRADRTRQRRTKHGECANRSTSAEYKVWQGMKERCSYSKHKDYRYYGGRGIRVCERWQRSFSAFLADMGRRPSPKHSIERKNSDCDYKPSNCRWATSREQWENRRDPRIAKSKQTTKNESHSSHR